MPIPTPQTDPLAASKETGILGVFHLKRFWSKAMLTRRGSPPSVDPADEWVRDKIVIFGLNLALEETFQYLFQSVPSFAEFEQWILECNGGSIEPARIERINAAISGAPAVAQPVNDREPVLSPADLAFWDEHGYVIVHDAVPEADRRAAVEAISEHLDIDLDEPDSWYRTRSDHGIMVQLYRHPALGRSRNSPRIRQAYAELWGTADLWASVDRVSFNPPERPGFEFSGPHLHWDTSLELPIPFGLLGLVYLTDTAADQGAFTCVPGFHRRIDDWLRSLPSDTDPRQADLNSLGAVPIAGRAGDLIIWHQALPHGSSPNRARLPRIVQYVQMLPVNEEHQSVWK